MIIMISRMLIARTMETLRKIVINAYRVSQKFVLLITCDITLDRNIHFSMNFLKGVYCFTESIYSENQYLVCLPLFVIAFRNRCGDVVR